MEKIKIEVLKPKFMTFIEISIGFMGIDNFKRDREKCTFEIDRVHNPTRVERFIKSVLEREHCNPRNIVNFKYS